MRFISYNVSDSYYEFIGENNEKYIVPQTDIILVEEENSISVKNIASRQTIGYLVKAVTPPTPTYTYHVGVSEMSGILTDAWPEGCTIRCLNCESGDTLSVTGDYKSGFTIETNKESIKVNLMPIGTPVSGKMVTQNPPMTSLSENYPSATIGVAVY